MQTYDMWIPSFLMMNLHWFFKHQFLPHLQFQTVLVIHTLHMYIYIYSHCIPISPKKSTIKLDVIPHQSIVISGVSPCFTATSKISKTLCQAEERSQAEALAEHHAGSIRFSDEKHWKNPWAVGMYIWIWQYCWLMSVDGFPGDVLIFFDVIMYHFVCLMNVFFQCVALLVVWFWKRIGIWAYK